MAQLVHMDACLNTLSDELCQVNTRISRIPPAFEDESDDGSDSDDANGASSPSDDEMST